MRTKKAEIKQGGKIWGKALIAYFLLVLFFLAFVFAGRSILCSSQAKGTVTEISKSFNRDGEEQYLLKIAFRDEEGTSYEVGQISEKYPAYEVNQTVDVHYNPDRPEAFYLSKDSNQ